MNPIINIILTDDSEIKVELMPEYAQKTVDNFLDLVEKRFYDGVIFHRVIENFMIQTGGYYIENNILKEKETNKTIKGEFSANGINNELKHTCGTISMARTQIMDSASSQFFICSTDCPHLDGNYAAFGRVIDEKSLNNVIKISQVKTGMLSPTFANFPYEPVIIKTIEVISSK